MSMLLCLIVLVAVCSAFNGELAELECPDDCECHYFRVNWVTDCSESNLTEIPYNELSPNVYVLDMNSNLIKELKRFPSEIKLRRLQLADNLLTKITKDPFIGLNYLIDLDLSHNQIKTIDPDTFEEMRGLLTLELQENPLDPVDGPFLSSKSLTYLDISSCHIKYLNPHFFINLTALSTIDLSNNPLKAIDNEAFAPLTGLNSLNLNNCNLTFISPNAFMAQENLKKLELGGNMLVKFDFLAVFKNLIRLEYLDLRNSHVTDLPPNTFEYNTYLRTLILAENDLGYLDVSVTIGKHLHELDTLDLSFCNLQNLLSEDAFSNSTKVRVLNLSGNSLFASDLLVALAPLTNLKKLSLSNCGLSKLPDTFEKFKGLQELDISHNPLNDVFIKLLSPLEALEYLNMGYSNLSYISPTTFSKMTSMKRLVLSGNDLNSLEAGLFGGLTQLESLELNNCGLRRPLNATLFFNNLTYTGLKELQLAGNPLQVAKHGPLLPKQFSELLSLDLSYCNLSFLPPEAFFWTRNLTHLILAGNRFSSTEGLAFLELLPKLEVLDLRFNNLSRFSPKDIAVNSNIQKLKLIGNPWICDCSVADLWDWANLEKSNLGVLEGSMLNMEDVTVGKTKKKKLLLCSYDSKVPMPIIVNKTATGRRPFQNHRLLVSTNRTWAKYVRESGCDQKISPVRVPRSIKYVIDDKIVLKTETGPNTWIYPALYALSAYVAIMAVVAVIYLLNYKKKGFHYRDQTHKDS
ncbi:toll-like receptor 3 isoform X2 [Agrilus planipennis]|nr:toll-like receptor 3 isoform X2 [Agrilus planipennis]